MSTLIEKYEAIKQTVHPDRLAIATTIAMLSVPVLVPLQSVLTYLVHESGERLSTKTMQILAIALIGIANAISIAVETKALEEKEYSASPMSTIFKMAIKNSLGIAAAGHAINFAQIYLANPVQILNFISLQSGGGSRLFFENAIGVTLSLSLWKLVFNALILYVDVEKLKEPAKKIYQKLKPNHDINPMREIDLIQ